MNPKTQVDKQSIHIKYGLIQIDSVTILTVVCLLVVLILHHATYTLDFLSPIRPFQIHRILQRFAVGGFIFLSGFKLTKAKITVSTKDFILNRISKIYGLYLFALAVFSFTAYPHLNDGKFPSVLNFILHAFALQSVFPGIFGRNFHTLWFVSVLFVCYGLFLALRNYLNTPKYFIFAALLLTLSISLIRYILLRNGITVLQNNLEIWVLFFLAGMLYASKAINIKDKSNLITKKEYLTLKIISFVGLLALVIYYNIPIKNINLYFKFLEITFVILALVPLYIIVLNIKFYGTKSVSDILSLIAYSSYCVFLLHRPVWSICSMIWSERSFAQAAFIFIVGISLIIISSFILQKSYGNLTKAIFRYK